MKHTPGPWTFHQNGDGSYSILGKKISEKEYQWIVGFIQNGEFWTEEQLANAKLIAAAPEMLKALQGVISHDDALVERYKISPSLIFQVENAIKKATE
jgi:hypothetical protein